MSAGVAMTTFQLAGYGDGIQSGVPATNDLGGKSSSGTPTVSSSGGLSPAVWMVIFLVVGYVGLRWLIE